MPVSTSISGYDFANTVITRRKDCGDIVETFCKFSDGAECDWLEFKASVVFLEKYAKPGETPKDLHWNIAHELIAMMNSTGGVLIIGVEDKTHALVPFENETDPRNQITNGGIEQYIRTEIMSHVNPERGRSWTDKNQVTWELEKEIPVQIRPEIITYHGEKIVALLVPPSTEELVFVTQRSRAGKAPKVPIRRPGSIGQATNLEDPEAWYHYKNERIINRECFAQWAEKISTPSTEWDTVDESKLKEKFQKFADALSHARNTSLTNYVDLTAALCEIPQNSPHKEPSSPSQPFFQSDDLSEAETFDLVTQQDGQDDTIDEFDHNSIRIVPNSERPLLALLEEEPRIALIGEPGQGKSTGLQKFVVTKMMRPNNHPSLYLYIELGRWHAGGSVEALIRSVISLAEFEYLRKSQRIHLILDALNECADNLKPAAKCSIRSFLSAYPDLPVIISARKPDDLKDFNLRTFIVCPLDRARQEKYLTNRLNNPTLAATLLQCIYARSGGESLASNPMLLRMVAEVAKENARAELPTGRAKLYRTWTKIWFNGEMKKARFANTSLDFNTPDEARRYISQIAFIGLKNNGQRAVPTSLVTSLIAQRRNGEKNIVFQGPFLRLKYDHEEKQNFIHFLHETFQEYLCGERLLEVPTEVSDICGQDFSTWEMPLAYALELNGDNRVPPPLISMLTKRSPWLAAVIKHTERLNSAHNPIEQFFADACHGNVSDLVLVDMFKTGWYSQNDKTLTYIILTNEKLRNEWLIFERNIFNTLFSTSFIRYTDPELARKAFNRFFNSRLVLTFKDLQSVPDAFTQRISEDSEFVCNILTTEFISPDHISARIHEKINRMKSSLSATQLLTYKKCRLISENEFLLRSRSLIKKATLHDATLLIDQGIATPSDFANQAGAWEQEAVTDVDVARTMIHARLLDAQGLLDIFRALQTTPSPVWARRAMEYGLLSKENLVQLARPLLKACRPALDEIRFLNLIMPEKTSEKLPSWLPAVPLEQLGYLFKEKIVTSSAIQPIIDEFLSDGGAPTPGEILALCRLAPQAVQANAEKWIHTLDLKDLADLCETPTMLPEFLACEIRKSIRNVNSISDKPSIMRRLICSGIIPRDLPTSDEKVLSLDVVLDKMNAHFRAEWPSGYFEDYNTMDKAVVIESTPRYAILKMCNRNRTAICLPSTLQERMMVLGDIWEITIVSTSKGYKVDRAELLTRSPWCGENSRTEASCGKETPIGLKMKAIGFSHPVYWRADILRGLNPHDALHWQIEFAPRFCRTKNRFLLAVLKASAV